MGNVISIQERKRKIQGYTFRPVPYRGSYLPAGEVVYVEEVAQLRDLYPEVRSWTDKEIEETWAAYSEAVVALDWSPVERTELFLAYVFLAQAGAVQLPTGGRSFPLIDRAAEMRPWAKRRG